MSDERKHISAVWIFDFDGTLSEIVPERHNAVIHPDCARMLAELTQDQASVVVVMSSRTLDDLIHRVPLQNITLAACSGLEMRLSDGQIRLPETAIFRQVVEVRSTLLPLIASLQSSVTGVDLEDKTWSMTIHYRNVPTALKPKLRSLLSVLRTVPGLKLFAGPEAMEVAFLPQVDKSRGIRQLLDLLRIDLGKTNLVYSGDDQNDAKAMRWILSRSGAAIVVGNRIRVKGATVVQEPAELAIKIMGWHTSWKQEHLFRL